LGDDLFEGVCVCPEAPDQDINYRKPSPKYGFEILKKYKKNLHYISYMGDNVTDFLTANNIGCMGVGVNTVLHDLRQALQEQGLEGSFPVFDCFLAPASHLAHCR
jgi:histidinol phosphatase-like enzyme